MQRAASFNVCHEAPGTFEVPLEEDKSSTGYSHTVSERGDVDLSDCEGLQSVIRSDVHRLLRNVMQIRSQQLDSFNIIPLIELLVDRMSSISRASHR